MTTGHAVRVDDLMPQGYRYVLHSTYDSGKI